ncbi:MAG TPA: hypothetical protein V6D29_06535 [Leptolyngbyaceae cyanobacterium]
MLNLPFLTAEIDSLPVVQGPAHPTKAAHRFTTLCTGLLVLGVITLAGCQNKTSQREANTDPTPIITAPQATPEVTPQSPSASQSSSSAAEKATPEASIAAAPSATTNSQLPEALVKQWEPLSNVLFEFGAMSITPSSITWNSGQTSSYSVVEHSDGYLLKLDAAPKFFDTTQPYIKLIPKQDETGAVREVEVAFYENQQKAESDEYIMFGTYTVK